MEHLPTTTTDNASVPANANIAITPELLSQAMEKSTSLDKGEVLMTLTAEYLELEKPSESFRGVFIGFQELTITNKQTGELEPLTAARFIINKQVFVNAGKVLISEINRAAIPVGTPLEVTYERKEGNTKIYSIALLG
jgi:hypothetical protein